MPVASDISYRVNWRTFITIHELNQFRWTLLLWQQNTFLQTQWPRFYCGKRKRRFPTIYFQVTLIEFISGWRLNFAFIINKLKLLSIVEACERKTRCQLNNNSNRDVCRSLHSNYSRTVKQILLLQARNFPFDPRKSSHTKIVNVFCFFYHQRWSLKAFL